MEGYDNAWAIHSHTGCPNHQQKGHIFPWLTQLQLNGKTENQVRSSKI